MKTLLTLNSFITKYFSLIVIIVALLAYAFPEGFIWIKPYINPLLGIIMLSMGINLKFDDFKEVFKNPKGVFIGVVAQFIIMPSLAFLLAKGFNLPPQIAVGVILVGSCPGGTSSNVITYLSKGNTALSIACTTISTLLAPILTPAIFYLLASSWLEVNASAMFISIVQIVLIPIIVGVLLNKFFESKLTPIANLSPMISVICIVMIVAAVVSLNTKNINASTAIIFGVVILHNILGYILGYIISKIFKLNVADSKAISVEVGMQNSGLATALALKYFEPVSAVAGAIFSVWHNISGSILSMIYAKYLK